MQIIFPDPCLYIHRFCHQFQLAEKENEVANTALRLVSRMKRDWIQYGRRPSGLCGAALLVSARLHGFSRTIKDVVKVVRLSNTTIRKRLTDFKKTPSGQLTIDEFNNIDLEEEQDPPCFTEARQKQKQQQIDEVQGLDKPALEKELEELRKAIEARLSKAKSQSECRESCSLEEVDTESLKGSTSVMNGHDGTLGQASHGASILEDFAEKDTCGSPGVNGDILCDGKESGASESSKADEHDGIVVEEINEKGREENIEKGWLYLMIVKQ